MRLAPRAASLSLASAALLVACSVEVDGAPCTVPGETGDCPAGQACGNDLRCSARALSCQASRCDFDASFCPTVAVAMRCDRSDPVCGRWVQDDCAARAMECGPRGSGACECPEPEAAVTVVVADPRGSPSRGASPFPRGQSFPPECRYGKLGDALDAASASTAAAVTVRIEGEEGEQAVFGTAETGEDRPLAVGPRVALVAPGAPAVIRGNAGVTSPAAILRVDGSAEGLRVEANGATGVGIAVECSVMSTEGSSLRRVRVSGGASFDPASAVTGLARGIAMATSSCANRSVRLEGVEVERVSGPALLLEPDLTTTVTVLGGSYTESNTGIELRAGHLTVAYDPATASTPTIARNAAEGIVVGGMGGWTVDATVERAFVDSNGGTGIVVSGLAEPASRVRLTGCDVRANGAIRPDGTGWGTTVGGVVVKLADSRTLVFAGNRLWGNAGDQLGFASDVSWTIGPTGGCGPNTNQFACVDAGAHAVSLYTEKTATVSVPWNIWPGNPFLQFIGPGVVNPGTSFCPAPQPPLACP